MVSSGPMMDRCTQKQKTKKKERTTKVQKREDYFHLTNFIIGILFVECMWSGDTVFGSQCDKQ